MNANREELETRTRRYWLLVCGALFLVFAAQPFMCTCGHLPQVTLPFTGLGALFAWAAFSLHRHEGIAGKVFIVGLVSVTTVLLMKNSLDVLFFGHYPIFPSVFHMPDWPRPPA